MLIHTVQFLRIGKKDFVYLLIQQTVIECLLLHSTVLGAGNILKEQIT